MKIPIPKEYDRPLSYDKLPVHLKNDAVHAWRAKTGIELIHREPSLKELNRIWNNWNMMCDSWKIISDKKSMELFGIPNEQHYNELLSEYPLKNSHEKSIKESVDLLLDIYESACAGKISNHTRDLLLLIIED